MDERLAIALKTAELYKRILLRLEIELLAETAYLASRFKKLMRELGVDEYGRRRRR